MVDLTIEAIAADAARLAELGARRRGADDRDHRGAEHQTIEGSFVLEARLRGQPQSGFSQGLIAGQAGTLCSAESTRAGEGCSAGHA